MTELIEIHDWANDRAKQILSSVTMCAATHRRLRLDIAKALRKEREAGNAFAGSCLEQEPDND